jgi:hypothetical protein
MAAAASIEPRLCSASTPTIPSEAGNSVGQIELFRGDAVV